MMTITAPNPWQQTFSGGRFHPMNPRVADVNLADLAHHLALANRFRGATRVPYSVAQHSVLVSLRLEDQMAMATMTERSILTAALFGLLHDGAEAYLADVPRPVKRHLAGYREIENQVQAVVYQAFGLDPDREPVQLKLVDRRMLRTEQRDLMPPAPADDDRTDVEPYPNRIEPADWQASRDMFVARFDAIQKDLIRLHQAV